MTRATTLAAAVLALTGLLPAGTAAAAGWGTVKGQVTFGGGKLPENKEAEVKTDARFCLKDGKISENTWVVEPKSKGVKWVLVWLTEVKNADGKNPAWNSPIHPKLLAVPRQVTIDQPVCTFIPRVMAMREGSALVVKNSAQVAHNTNIQGGILGPNINKLLQPKEELEIAAKDVKARPIPFSYSCNIHPWMKGWVGVFKHPYFAVTDEKGEFVIKDAPEGKYRLMVWHEDAGFIQKSSKDRGLVIDIKDRKTTTVDAAKLKISPAD